MIVTHLVVLLQRYKISPVKKNLFELNVTSGSNYIYFEIDYQKSTQITDIFKSKKKGNKFCHENQNLQYFALALQKEHIQTNRKECLI